eukprot:jgi/Astpho2/6068/fgenesh1_pg.00084_%23_57_t
MHLHAPAGPPVKHWKCQLALAATQTAFCIGSVYLKSSIRTASASRQFHPIIYAFAREAVAGPIMCSIAWFTSRTLPKRRDLLPITGIGICLYLNQLFFILGIDLSGVVVAACMQPTVPVFTALIAVMLKLEAGSLQKFCGIALAVAGSISMVLGGVGGGSTKRSAAEGRSMLLGNLCLLLMAFSNSVYYLAAKQLVLRYTPMCVAAWAYIVAAACMGLTAGVAVERSRWELPETLYGPLLYWIVVCSVAGYYFVTWATQHLPASQVAAFQCLQPFVGTLLAFVVLQEQPSLWHLGAVGVIAGLLIISRDKKDMAVISVTVEGGEHICTYHDLHKRSQLMALALKKLGVKPGAVVASMAWNGYRHMECWYGTMGLGAVLHTLNPRLFAAELEYIVNHAQDQYIFVDLTFVLLMAQLQDKLRCVKGFVVLTDGQHMPRDSKLRDMLCYEELLQEQVPNLPFVWQTADEHQACGLCYTSGTTGNPKGVLYSHRSNFLHAMAVSLPDCLNLSSRSVYLAIVPMFHANSWGLVFSAPLTGAKLVLPGAKLDGQSIHDVLERHHVTDTAGVPTIFMDLLRHMQQQGLKGFSTLRRANIGGAACPLSQIQQLDALGVETRHAWGMTETSPICTLGSLKGTYGELTKEQEHALRARQGRPHVLVDMRIVDDSGKELPMDGKAAGEVQVRGPTIMNSYFKHNGSSEVDRDGWFKTGDVATLDKFGVMTITDRSKDVIKSGGEWISSIAIENIAVSHPKVAEAAVIAIPDKKWTERPLLVCVKAEGQKCTKDDMLDFLKPRMSKWWLPEKVVFVKEIPHTATGKISKLQLRKQFQKAGGNSKL